MLEKVTKCNNEQLSMSMYLASTCKVHVMKMEMENGKMQAKCLSSHHIDALKYTYTSLLVLLRYHVDVTVKCM